MFMRRLAMSDCALGPLVREKVPLTNTGHGVGRLSMQVQLDDSWMENHAMMLRER